MKKINDFLVGFIGGAIGTLISLETGFFWPLGFVLGFLIGYLENPLEVIKAVPLAFRRAASKELRPIIGTSIKATIIFFTGTVFILIDVLILIFIINHILFITGIPHRTPDTIDLFILFGFFIFLSVLFSFISLTLILDAKENINEASEEIISYSKTMSKIFFKKGNPFTVFIIYPLVGLGLFFTLGIPFIGRFLKHLFLFIHSDIRVMKGAYILIGVSVGFAFGSILVGGFVGGALTFLAPKRWVKKIPCPQERKI